MIQARAIVEDGKVHVRLGIKDLRDLVKKDRGKVMALGVLPFDALHQRHSLRIGLNAEG